MAKLSPSVHGDNGIDFRALPDIALEEDDRETRQNQEMCSIFGVWHGVGFCFLMLRWLRSNREELEI